MLLVFLGNWFQMGQNREKKQVYKDKQAKKIQKESFTMYFTFFFLFLLSRSGSARSAHFGLWLGREGGKNIRTLIAHLQKPSKNDGLTCISLALGGSLSWKESLARGRFVG